MTNKEIRELTNKIDKIIDENNLNLKTVHKNNYIILVFPSTNDFKEQWYFIILKESTIKNFTEQLEDVLNLENLDETAIFMYKKLRKTPITLKETIDEAENRRKKLTSFIDILNKTNNK